MITPFNHTASTENFPTPKKLQIFKHGDIAVQKTTKDTSNTVSELLGFIPGKNDAVIFSYNIWSELWNIESFLEWENAEVNGESKKIENFIIITPNGIYSIPVDFFTNKSIEELQVIDKNDLEWYIIVKSIVNHLPKKYTKLTNALALIEHYDPTIIETLWGIDTIKAYLTALKKIDESSHITLGYFRALIWIIYSHYSNTQDNKILYNSDAIKRRTLDLKFDIRKTLYPEFISTLPKIEEWQWRVYTSRYEDIKVIDAIKVQESLLWYALGENEIILESFPWMSIIWVTMWAKEIFGFYPEMSAVLCEFNGRIIRLTPEIMEIQDNNKINPWDYQIK